mmetsp:Transcript_20669/g.41199  ORF Transcript_20669/g.41199 Transcript_20669/m.41199 type:complete len:84 (-) Transcript_20669:22-273(-)
MAACNPKPKPAAAGGELPKDSKSSSRSSSSRCSCSYKNSEVSPEKVFHFRQNTFMISLIAFSVFESVARYYFPGESSKLYLGS